VTVGARERLPSPMAIDCVVINDVATRTLVVRLPDSAGGHVRSLWGQAFHQLRRAEEEGWPAAYPFLWGGAFGDRQIVHGRAGDGLSALFHFPPGAGAGVYARLIGKPGLYAIATIDRGLSRFMSVQFLNRP
jgi:hypothetical protein